ncbi:Methyltransferase type 11 domain protein [Candidatus Magnetomorum sp. HK-1]|nr:Methyltransferase type 11 domain protein [Candidatus Magnetomorum sp. HK-1]
MNTHPFWEKKILGVEAYKIKFNIQNFLYKFLSITLPKMKTQKDYWNTRGEAYMFDILNTGFEEREIFFQNMLVDHLKELPFDSIFEAGCGFGWNVKKIKQMFPDKRVGGVDFSLPQLKNSETYLKGMDINLTQGDILNIPLEDNEFDIGFSMGVFLNIHSINIDKAVNEMIRVSKKYIIHIEYDEDNTTEKLREHRVPKTNIISHNYRKIYEDLGLKTITFQTYKDFNNIYEDHIKKVSSKLNRWENFEGSEKYIFAIFQL